MAHSIDLNCDMGEGFGVYEIGNDDKLLDIVTSANIACGFHAGDPLVMYRTIKMANARGVAVGAHPGFLDLWGFGRRPILNERPDDIEKHIIYQIGAIQAMAASLGWPITHFKPHGALGNMAAVDADLARATANAVKVVDPSLAFVAMPFSESFKAGEAAGLNVVCEVFADRTYDDHGNLTSRRLPGAVIHDVTHATEHVLRMVIENTILTTGGKRLRVDAQTICIHGDTPQAPQIARQMRAALEAAGLIIRSYVR